MPRMHLTKECRVKYRDKRFMRRKKEVGVVRFRRNGLLMRCPSESWDVSRSRGPMFPPPPIAPSVSAHGCPGLMRSILSLQRQPSLFFSPNRPPRAQFPIPPVSLPPPPRNRNPFSRASNRRPHSTAPVLATGSSKRIPSLAFARNSQRRYQNRNPPFHHITSNETTNRAAFDPSILSELGPSRAPAYFYCCH